MSHLHLNISIARVAIPAFLCALSYQCIAQSPNVDREKFAAQLTQANGDLNAANEALEGAKAYATEEQTREVSRIQFNISSIIARISALTAPGGPKLTIRGGSTGLESGEKVFSVDQKHGKKAQTTFMNPVTILYLGKFSSTPDGPPVDLTKLTVLNNWRLTITYRGPDSSADTSATMIVCPNFAAGICIPDSNPVTSKTVTFVDGGLGQFYLDSDDNTSARYTITDACQGLDTCDHISQVTIDTIPAQLTPTYYCTTKKGQCNVFLKDNDN
jgi:hypothetical protein